MACVLSSSLFTCVLVILCIVRGVMAGLDTSDYLFHENFTFGCDNYYVSETLQRRSCTIDTKIFSQYKCIKTKSGQLYFYRENDFGNSICTWVNVESTTPCLKTNPSKHGDITCTVSGSVTTFTCYFNTSKEFLGQQMFCAAYCTTTINEKSYTDVITNSTCPVYTGVPTLEPPTTAVPTTTAAPPEKEFPIWAAVVIALGIGGLIALLLFLVWRKRRQAQNLAQDAEGGNTGNPEGEEAEGGGDDAEEEEATNAESAEKSEDAEGGEEAPEEE